MNDKAFRELLRSVRRLVPCKKHAGTILWDVGGRLVARPRRAVLTADCNGCLARIVRRCVGR
jgi:hypothetical protein